MIGLGDRLEDSTVSFTWNSSDLSGASITRATNGTISVYKDGGVTQSIAGITDTEDFDGLTGVHLCVIDTSSDSFYSTGSDYDVVLSAATIDGQTVNATLAHFSIEMEAAVQYLKNGTYGLAAIEALVDDLEARLTATRAGYLDNLSAGAVATAAALSTHDGKLDTVDSNVDAILVDTAEIGVAGAGLTNINLPNQTMDIVGNITGNLSGSVGSVTGNVGGIAGTITTLDALDTAQDSQHAQTQSDISGLNNLSAAQVNTEVDTALADIHLDHLLATTYDPASKPGAADALLNEMIGDDGGVSQFTANALELAPTGGSAPTAADIRAEIDANSTQLAAIVADTNELQTNQGNWLTATVVDLNADQSAVTIGTVTTNSDMRGTDNAATAASLATHDAKLDTVDGVVDSILVDTAEIGVAGAGLTNINLPNQTMDITGNLSGSVGSVTGSVGGIAGTITTLDALDTAQDVQHAQTQSDIASLNNISAAQVNAEVDTALADYDGPTHAELVSEINDVQSDIAGLNNLSAAQVNAEVVDVLSVDMFAEPTGVPAATASLAVKIGYFYAALRNKVTVTATKKIFFDDSDASMWEKDLSDDGTTYTETEGNAP